MSKTPPAAGERRALSGYLPQYKLAAGWTLDALTAGTLISVRIADLEAGELDDFQLHTRAEGGTRLDAFQVKWGIAQTAVGEGTFRGWLATLVKGRGVLIERDRKGGELPVPSRHVAHLVTSRPPSTAKFTGELKGTGRTLAAFLADVWMPLQGASFGLDHVPANWRSYLDGLANACGLSTTDLVALAPNLRFSFNQRLPEEEVASDSEGTQRLRDLAEVNAVLSDAVIDRKKTVRLDLDDLLSRLGSHWRRRARPAGLHEFPSRTYEPIEETTQRLRTALEKHRSGYVFLVGTPGSGKSTLLTEELRSDRRLAARYYAFVPQDDRPNRGESEDFLFDLVRALESQTAHGSAVLPAGVELLRDRFRKLVDDLGETEADGESRIIVIDGLDHVLRDPKPSRSLLDELLPPDEVPDGIVFVIGTRDVDDLPAHVRPAARGDRLIETAPLTRQAVAEIVEVEGAGSHFERIFELSQGHPLLVWTLLRLLENVADDERGLVLADLPPLDGEILPLYEQIWEDLKGDVALVALLGLICRLRGRIDLGWLEDTGTDAEALVRLEQYGYLFRRATPGQWSFFHSSFREFLIHRTGERAGAFDAKKASRLHKELARRCLDSPSGSLEHWEAPHHFLHANEQRKALEVATPAFFRAQLDALRPPEDVRTDLQEVAGALAETHDPILLLRIVLAASELDARDMQIPSGSDLPELLVDLGKVELAIAHVRRTDDSTMGNDRHQAGMQLALDLHNKGIDDAKSVFELFEPLEWFGGPTPERTGPSGGPWQALYAWADAAAVIRGTDYVLEMVARLDLSGVQVWGTDDESDEERTDNFRQRLLAELAASAVLPPPPG